MAAEEVQGVIIDTFVHLVLYFSVGIHKYL